MDNHPFDPAQGGYGYPLNQNPDSTPEYPSTRQNAGENVYAPQAWDSSASMISNAGHSYPGPQLFLPIPVGQDHHHIATQSAQMSGVSYGLQQLGSWSNTGRSGHGQRSQNPGSGSAESTDPMETPGPSSSHLILPDLVYVSIKKAVNTEGNTIIAKFSKSQEFSVMDIRVAESLNLEIHPIPPARQIPIFTDIGLATPQCYTTFVCDIPELGLKDWTTHVQLLQWDQPPGLRIGKKFRQRLERERPITAGQETTHMQPTAHDMASPFLHTPVLGNASFATDGASMQVAENSTYVRSPTIPQSALFLRIPEPPMGYPNSVTALTPGGSSTGWPPTSLFDINNTGTGPSPSTSFQDLTPGLPGEDHSGESWCPDIDYPQSHASGPYSGDAPDLWSSQWSTM
ncbi:hypothetical protein QBC44DRAFT_2654 [Cladorrhinum sp. PSN332]|nr:hypothetical protein QBC44DRAFT_2654 [Cladorrhinum sp. PSN332]